MSNLESGQPWTHLDEQDLRDGLRRNFSIAWIADFICRDVAEVEAKAKQIAAERAR